MKVARPYITDLELRVLTLMAQGVPVKAIGTRIGLSAKGVSSARRRVLERNGLKNYLQLGMLLERAQMLPTRHKEERLDAQRAAL